MYKALVLTMLSLKLYAGVEYPALTGYVNDVAGKLSVQEKNALEKKLQATFDVIRLKMLHKRFSPSGELVEREKMTEYF